MWPYSTTRDWNYFSPEGPAGRSQSVNRLDEVPSVE